MNWAIELDGVSKRYSVGGRHGPFGSREGPWGGWRRLFARLGGVFGERAWLGEHSEARGDRSAPLGDRSASLGDRFGGGRGAVVGGRGARVEGRGSAFDGRDELSGGLRNDRPLGRRGSPLGADRDTRHLWALREVSLSVQPGESVGLIGHNGAGKTTVLRLLAGITRPTVGQVRCAGRVASLINLGAGFHPELTGRENIFLNGVILGLTRGEVRDRLEQIIEFADLGAYIDTPLKRYSSGMYARLGFAIAAHVDPDVLLVDEVLSVGDVAFQDRSIRKMLSFRDSGQAVLFVSHNLSAVEMMCQRTIWLDHGRIRMQGPTGEVVRAYLDAVDEALIADAAASFRSPSSPNAANGGSPDHQAEQAASTEEAASTEQVTDCQPRPVGLSNQASNIPPSEAPTKAQSDSGQSGAVGRENDGSPDHQVRQTASTEQVTNGQPRRVGLSNQTANIPPSEAPTSGRQVGDYSDDLRDSNDRSVGDHSSDCADSTEWSDSGQTAPAVIVRELSVLDSVGHLSTDFSYGEALHVRLRCLARREVIGVSCSVTVRGDYGPLFSASSQIYPTWTAGAHDIECIFERLPLLPGLYRVEVQVRDASSPAWAAATSVAAFRVTTQLVEFGSNSLVGATKSRGGFLAVPYDWRVHTEAGEEVLPGLRLPSTE